MSQHTVQQLPSQSASSWLKGYYATRFAFSAIWVTAAFTVAKTAPGLAAALLVIYPAWDAIANYADADRSGGLAQNKSQLLNFIVSIVTAVAVAIALTKGMPAVVFVFGIWAAFAGLFQLVTGVRRWKTIGAQWAMILSGAQSVLAGAHMLVKAGGADPLGITTIAPYAAFGAFYFLISSISLAVIDARRGHAPTAA